MREAKASGALLADLLKDERRKESSVILQALRFIVRSELFTEPGDGQREGGGAAGKGAEAAGGGSKEGEEVVAMVGGSAGEAVAEMEDAPSPLHLMLDVDPLGVVRCELQAQS